MLRLMLSVSFLYFITIFSPTILAKESVNTQSQSPVGVWKTIDDKTGKAKSYVTIEEKNGILDGVVSKILNPEKKNAVCEKCEGKDKNKKVQGLTVLWGMKKSGNGYKGKILDPDSGKVYSSTLHVHKTGNKLTVRGYVLLPLFGRSQTWDRVSIHLH